MTVTAAIGPRSAWNARGREIAKQAREQMLTGVLRQQTRDASARSSAHDVLRQRRDRHQQANSAEHDPSLHDLPHFLIG
ncbi:hypothetical protein [Oleiagrimonas sp.]|uniref:hypothetical protein n=1 Tax=Oleiagrimonas sp. TaxID=2010330 RepID=UPI002618FB82|nr:hypothetical protein [Oleiagrimonas sp.]MDA3913916.1 hypothetical protein [Oleiagrimonas sp.]